MKVIRNIVAFAAMVCFFGLISLCKIFVRFSCAKVHQAFVNSVGFSPNGQILASGSGGRTIQFWNVSMLFDGGKKKSRLF